MNPNTVYHCDALTLLRRMDSESVHCIVTSPPYFGLRDYGADGQIGREQTPQEYVARLVEVFREARRVLRNDGVLFLNLGDSYSGSSMTGGIGSKKGSSKRSARMFKKPASKHELPPKNLLGIPWRVAFALQDDGWILRSDIIWSKPNPMPESVKDRPTKSHEYIFLFAKSERYYYDADAIAEPVSPDSLARLERGISETHKNADGAPGQRPHTMSRPRVNVRKQDATGNRRYTGFNERYFGGGGFSKAYAAQQPAHGGESVRRAYTTRNKRSVWTVSTKPFKGAHFATFPPELIEPMILAGCPAGGVVLDMFFGAGTTGYVAQRLGRQWIGCDINADYVALARERLAVPYSLPMFAQSTLVDNGGEA